MHFAMIRVVFAMDMKSEDADVDGEEIFAAVLDEAGSRLG